MEVAPRPPAPGRRPRTDLPSCIRGRPARGRRGGSACAGGSPSRCGTSCAPRPGRRSRRWARPAAGWCSASSSWRGRGGRLQLSGPARGARPHTSLPPPPRSPRPAACPAARPPCSAAPARSRAEPSRALGRLAALPPISGRARRHGRGPRRALRSAADAARPARRPCHARSPAAATGPRARRRAPATRPAQPSSPPRTASSPGKTRTRARTRTRRTCAATAAHAPPPPAAAPRRPPQQPRAPRQGQDGDRRGCGVRPPRCTAARLLPRGCRLGDALGRSGAAHCHAKDPEADAQPGPRTQRRDDNPAAAASSVAQTTPARPQPRFASEKGGQDGGGGCLS